MSKNKTATAFVQMALVVWIPAVLVPASYLVTHRALTSPKSPTIDTVLAANKTQSMGGYANGQADVTIHERLYASPSAATHGGAR